VVVELDGHGAPRIIVLKPPGDETMGDRREWRRVEGDEKRWRVEAVGEVWRVDDEWWRQTISRRYAEVILEGGKHIVVFEDLASGHWFIQNI
jgi:hypothetical protein